jgi:hypothetical protein
MKIKLLSVLMAGAASSSVWAEGVTTQQTPASEQGSFYQSTINQLNQSTDDGEAIDLGIDWTKYISVSGGFYADAKAGDQTYETQGENTNRLAITNAHVTVNATPNTWTQLTVVTNYSGASNTYAPNPNNAESSVNKNNNISDSTTDNSVYIDQAYATFGDESRYPIFAQVGKQYLPFGQYNINPVVKSLSQILTETNATDAQVGFVVAEGLYGSAYVFQNSVNADGSTETDPYNGGVVLGFKKVSQEMNVDIGMGYMNNMSGVNSIANYIDQGVPVQGYGSSVSALAPYFSFQTGPFGINADYVSALSHFDKSTLPYEVDSADGAKPSAIDTQASYAFNRYDMNHVLFVGYQVSDQASALNLPKKRYLTGYNLYPLKNVVVGLEITRDTNYGESNVIGNTADGEDYYTYNARVGVQF